MKTQLEKLNDLKGAPTHGHCVNGQAHSLTHLHTDIMLAFTNNSKVQDCINKFLTSKDELGEDSKFLQLFMLQFYFEVLIYCLVHIYTHELHRCLHKAILSKLLINYTNNTEPIEP